MEFQQAAIPGDYAEGFAGERERISAGGRGMPGALRSRSRQWSQWVRYPHATLNTLIGKGDSEGQCFVCVREELN
ncbi:hypothetical protein JTE90_026234 [Oedothorax gibbosus]|uniref:Uncharacterized protein n=1 Tax=Oedothorax gibbosus TaxID=931172 RepID=A0AAV6UAV7_9ARAC|nr:hypothetical protein JTE90_026234 [Oedothorax gibbosus]